MSKNKNQKNIQIIEDHEYSENITDFFSEIPAVAKPLLKDARNTYEKIKHKLYTLPALYNAIRATVPEDVLQAVLTNDQKKQLAEGALKLMTKHDGTLLAKLINPETNKIIANIPLQSIKLTPTLSQALVNLSTQMQIAQMAEQLESIQFTGDEILQGLENDRLASAYSCKNQYYQALKIKDPNLLKMKMISITSEAEKSRNQLKLSQKQNIDFIMNRSTSLLSKVFNLRLNKDIEEKEKRMHEIHESFDTICMVSLIEAMAYQKAGENESAKESLAWCADYIKDMYLSTPGLVGRLDSNDKMQKDGYWSKTLPRVYNKIQMLPCIQETKLL